MRGVGFRIPWAPGWQRADPATHALIARMTAAPGAARTGRIDALVRALKATGVWARLDALYLLAAHDAQAARLNWVSTSYNLTAVNSPGFTTDRGYAGNGTTSYLDTGLAPSAGKGAANDGALGVWLNAGTNSAANVAAMGARDPTAASHIVPRFTGDVLRGRINSGPTVSGTGAVTTRYGFSAVSRTDSAFVSFYRDGAIHGAPVASAAGARATRSVYLGGLNNEGVFDTGTNNRIAAAFMGAGLSAGEIAALHAALSTYLTAIGAA